jgi:LacI family gluconate utilization system Gnt-I transcriptional repressor
MSTSGQQRRIPTIDDVVRIPAGDAGLPASATGPRRPPRIEEVARLAGVSPITVSRALRHPEKVAEDKRSRILEIVERTGYASNPHARALRSGRSTIVAAFISNIFSQQYGLAVQGCAEILEPHGYQLMLGQTSYSYARETSMIQALMALRPAAVLFTGVIELEENRRALRELGIPIMESWAYPRDPIDMLVGISNVDAGRLAAEHLAGRGYRRVAYMGRRGGRGALRLSGFREGARERGLELVAELSVETVTSIADGRAALGDLLDSAQGRIDAVFAANDLLAIGALLEVRRRGLAVPNDLAILGFGETDIAESIGPGLTTIAVDGAELGRRAGAMLLARLQGGEPEAPVAVFEPRLLLRGST